MDGTAVGAEETFTTSNKPVLSSLEIKPPRFRAAGKRSSRGGGATISYADSQEARTRFAILIATPGVARGARCLSAPKHGSVHGRRCRRYVKIAGLSHSDAAGLNKLRFSGRVGGRKLAAGHYKLAATPRAHRKTGATLSATFTIVG